MKNTAAGFACLHLAIAIILGAFGAHKLKELLSPESLESFKTAVSYHIYHALALLVLNLSVQLNGLPVLKYANRLIHAGILLFSGSIYLLSTKEITGLSSVSILGPVTPIGGALLISSWIMLTWHFFSSKKTS